MEEARKSTRRSGGPKEEKKQAQKDMILTIQATTSRFDLLSSMQSDDRIINHHHTTPHHPTPPRQAHMSRRARAGSGRSLRRFSPGGAPGAGDGPAGPAGGGQRQVAAFMDHYGKLYGPRWPGLYHAMLQPSRHVARVNRFAFASPSLDVSELERTMRRLAVVDARDDGLRLLAVPGQARLPLCLVGPETERNCFAPPATARARMMGTVVEEGQEEAEDDNDDMGFDGRSSSDCSASGSTSDEGEEEAEAEKEEAPPSPPATSAALSPVPPHQPGLLPYYLMDLASILAALALEVEEGHTVADICAAPGGKSLVLAEMVGPRGRLVVNDRSKPRSARLGRTVAAHVPEEFRWRGVQVKCQDASKWFNHAQHRQSYDRVLVDAPCGSERHLVQQYAQATAAAAAAAAADDDDLGLQEWAPGRTKRIANEQRALLSSAIRCLKPGPGARVVYSTCSISPTENDDVVAKTLKRNPDFHALGEGEALAEGTKLRRFVDACKAAGLLGELERGEFGWWILPDANHGWGPIYFCILERAA